MTVGIEDLARSVASLDQSWEQRAQQQLDRLAIPRGSLGRLMELGRQYAAVRTTLQPEVRRKRIYTFAADHGVTAEGVSAFPREVTRQMVINFMRGGAGINVLARHAGAEVAIVDIGVDHDFTDIEGLLMRKVRYGTGNIAREHAMRREEALQAMEIGADLACAAADEGIDLLGTGDMGIGNTTPSSAVIAAFSGLDAAQVTGRGTGIGEQEMAHKIAVVRTAIETHRPDPHDPVDVLSKVGGLEIAGIAGLVVGAASRKIPVVIDGFISGAGALIACELNSRISRYLVAAHRSVERGHTVMLERMNLVPLLDLDMRLGEGTGAALGMGLVEAGVKILTEVLTFDNAGVTEGRSE